MYVETSNASEAYRRAKPKSRKWNADSVKVQASRSLRDPHVVLTIEQIRTELRDRHRVTLDTITEMLREDRQLAHSVAQSGAAVSASMGLAKLHGLIVDKAELGGANGGPIRIVWDDDQ